MGFVVDVLDRLGVQAFDLQFDSGIFQPETAAGSWCRWRAIRDRALGVDGSGSPSRAEVPGGEVSATVPAIRVQ